MLEKMACGKEERERTAPPAQERATFFQAAGVIVSSSARWARLPSAESNIFRKEGKRDARAGGGAGGSS